MNYLNNKREVVTVPLNKLKRHPSNPFCVTNDASLKALTQSIKAHGIIEPLLLRAGENGMYEIISGQRRAAAAYEAGLQNVPALIFEMTDEEAVGAIIDSNLCIKESGCEDE